MPLRTVAHQAPLSMGILQARTLEWVAMPSSRGSSDPGMEPASLVSPAFQADSLLLSHQGSQVNGYTTANQTKIFLPLIYIFYIVSVSSGFSTTLKIFV